MEKSDKSSWFECCYSDAMGRRISFFLLNFDWKKFKKNSNFNFEDIGIANLNSPLIIKFFDVFRSNHPHYFRLRATSVYKMSALVSDTRGTYAD